MLAIRVEFFVLGHGEATHQCIKVCPPGLLDHSSGTQLIHYELSHCLLLNYETEVVRADGVSLSHDMCWLEDKPANEFSLLGKLSTDNNNKK